MTDPALDPEVQARVLEMYEAHLNKDNPKSLGAFNACIVTARIREGSLKLGQP